MCGSFPITAARALTTSVHRCLSTCVLHVCSWPYQSLHVPQVLQRSPANMCPLLCHQQWRLQWQPSKTRSRRNQCLRSRKNHVGQRRSRARLISCWRILKGTHKCPGLQDTILTFVFLCTACCHQACAQGYTSLSVVSRDPTTSERDGLAGAWRCAEGNRRERSAYRRDGKWVWSLRWRNTPTQTITIPLLPTCACLVKIS